MQLNHESVMFLIPTCAVLSAHSCLLIGFSDVAQPPPMTMSAARFNPQPQLQHTIVILTIHLKMRRVWKKILVAWARTNTQLNSHMALARNQTKSTVVRDEGFKL